MTTYNGDTQQYKPGRPRRWPMLTWRAGIHSARSARSAPGPTKGMAREETTHLAAHSGESGTAAISGLHRNCEPLHRPDARDGRLRVGGLLSACTARGEGRQMLAEYSAAGETHSTEQRNGGIEHRSPGKATACKSPTADWKKHHLLGTAPPVMVYGNRERYCTEIRTRTRTTINKARDGVGGARRLSTRDRDRLHGIRMGRKEAQDD